ncbi:hypothetical protein KUM39_13775 [Streptomyces sp. J2-1]|uniref:hypothetical protein n=1 Tax=Streptomyces corallincola TaxID=2851888 RepID=UPI001C383D41|nr:hypothetical protein [Streptomyces corallincola]MBV2355424.1 hypothetical protein [Streptomyces corallincola]
MAAKTEPLTLLRAVRQLRRVRAFYAAGALLWALAAALTGWTEPGSRRMWVAAALLAVFTGLLLTASLWLRRLVPASSAALPAHHAAPRPALAHRSTASA